MPGPRPAGSAHRGPELGAQSLCPRRREPRPWPTLVAGLAFGAPAAGADRGIPCRQSRPRPGWPATPTRSALILELKDLDDIGYRPPQDWLPHVLSRLQTETGKALAAAIMATRRDAWWWQAAVPREAGAEAATPLRHACS
ncbi:MAG: hypothetical protein MZV70_63115 [Desulfobacterales bacterium]|nr:hypothetical protein [Desulfobacterales bacterium]